MAAGGDLRDDPAVELVFFHLRMDDRGTDFPAILNDRGGGLIAAGFDTENFHTSRLMRQNRNSPARRMTPVFLSLSSES